MYMPASRIFLSSNRIKTQNLLPASFDYHIMQPDPQAQTLHPHTTGTHLETDQLQRGLEQALQALARSKGEALARQVKPILLANLDRGRLQTFVEETPARIEAYVWFVAQTYTTLNPYLHKLQTEQDAETWTTLYKRLQTWAYNFFLRKSFRADEHTREIAIECASDAATLIIKSHFPYDTEFDPWAHTIVQNACRKYIHRSLKKSNVPDEKKIELEDELTDPYQTLLEVNTLQKETGKELLEVLNQLSEARRTVIQLIFFEELSPEEVAQRMGKSISAIYTLQFHGLKDLRKILDTNRDIPNE